MLASEAPAGRDGAARYVGEAHAALRHVLVLPALTPGPERVDPALVEKLLVRLGNRNQRIRTVFSHQQVLGRRAPRCDLYQYSGGRISIAVAGGRTGTIAHAF